MLVQYWSWTSGSAPAGPDSGLPFGPVRYRMWGMGGVVPPVVVSAARHSWLVKGIGIKTKIAVHSQVDSDIGDTS